MTEFNPNCANFTTETGDKLLYPFGPPIFQSEVDPSFTKKLLEEGRELNIKENPLSVVQHRPSGVVINQRGTRSGDPIKYKKASLGISLHRLSSLCIFLIFPLQSRESRE